MLVCGTRCCWMIGFVGPGGTVLHPGRMGGDEEKNMVIRWQLDLARRQWEANNGIHA